MIEIAAKLNDSLGKLYNIFMYNTSIIDDKSTHVILEKFNNIPVNKDIISDE